MPLNDRATPAPDYGPAWAAPLRRVPSVWVAVLDQLLISGANFLLVVTVARSAGLAELGRFGLVFACILFLANVHTALVSQPFALIFSRCHNGLERDAYLAQLNRIHGWLLVIIPMSLVGYAWPEMGHLMVVAVAAAILRAGLEIQRRMAYGVGDTVGALLIDLVAVAPILCVVLLSLGGMRITAFFAILVMGIGGAGGWLFGWRLRAMGPRQGVATPGDVIRRHWQIGRWLLGSVLALWISTQSYPFMVAAYRDIEAAGGLQACLRLIGVAAIGLQALEIYALPRLAAASIAGDARFFHAMAWRTALAMLLPTLVVCIPGMLFPGLLALVFGAAVAPYATVLRVLSGVAILSACNRSGILILQARGHPESGFWGHAAGALLTLLVGPFVVQGNGVAGAGWMLLANAGLMSLVVFLYLLLPRRTRLAPLDGEVP
jgi:O-antigen/teichoic acid export membrane protein